MLVANGLGLRSAKDINDIAHAETLPGAIDGTQCFLSDDRSVEAFDFLCAVVTVTTCSIELFGEIVEQKFSTTEFQIAVSRHRVKFLQHDRRLVGVPFYFDKSLQFGDICVAIKEQRLTFQSVAAGSTGFLIVALDVL